MQFDQLLHPLLILSNLHLFHNNYYDYNNENNVLYCSPHVLACMLLLCCFSLKAFETLVREIIKERNLTSTDVKTIQVHNTSVSHHMHRDLACN